MKRASSALLSISGSSGYAAWTVGQSSPRLTAPAGLTRQIVPASRTFFLVSVIWVGVRTSMVSLSVVGFGGGGGGGGGGIAQDARATLTSKVYFDWFQYW